MYPNNNNNNRRRSVPHHLPSMHSAHPTTIPASDVGHNTTHYYANSKDDADSVRVSRRKDGSVMYSLPAHISRNSMTTTRKIAKQQHQHQQHQLQSRNVRSCPPSSTTNSGQQLRLRNPHSDERGDEHAEHRQHDFFVNQPKQDLVPFLDSRIANATSLNADDPKEHAMYNGVADWTAAALQDTCTFGSLSTWCEVTLRRVETETRKLETPNLLKTSVSCILLQRILSMCQPYDKIMNTLLNNILSSIFVEWEEFLSRKAHRFLLPGTEEEEERELHRHPPECVEDELDLEIDGQFGPADPVQKLSAFTLKGRPTFFQSFHDLQAHRVEFLGKPAQVLDRTLGVWRAKVKVMVFCAWRGLLRRQGKIRIKNYGIVEHRLMKKAEKALKINFGAWRTYVFEKRHQCRVVYEESMRVTLVHRMGRRIKYLEVENERLMRQLSAITTDHNAAGKRVEEMHKMWATFQKKLYETPNAEVTELVQQVTLNDYDQFAGEDGGTSGGSGGAERKEGQAAMTEKKQQQQEDEGGEGGEQQEEEAKTVEEELAEGYDNNDIALGIADPGKRRATPPPIVGAALRALNKDVDKAKKMPNKLAKLKDYLGLDEAQGEHPPLPSPQEEQPDGEGGGGEPKAGKHQKGDVASVAAAVSGGGGAALPGQRRHVRANRKQNVADVNKSNEAAGAGGDRVGPTAAASSPSAAAARGGGGDANESPGRKTDYRDVLDWVSLRVQLILTNGTVMRRCTNFTTNFRDSVRFAYLFVSLGMDKGLLDEIFTRHSLLERADTISKVVPAFFEAHERYLDHILTPIDIVKAKGSKMSQLLFLLYDKFGHLPLVAASGPVNPRLSAALDLVHGSPKSASGLSPKFRSPKAGWESEATADPLAATTTSSLRETDDGRQLSSVEVPLHSPQQSNKDAGGAGGAATTSYELPESLLGQSQTPGDNQDLPDSQYIEWYKELAAEDSEDAEEVSEEYYAIKHRKKSIVESIGERLSERVSRVMGTTDISIFGSGSDGGKDGSGGKDGGAAAALPYYARFKSKVRRHLHETNESMVKWVVEKLTLANGGAEPQEDVLQCTNAELLEKIIETMVPSARGATKSTKSKGAADGGGGNPLLRIKVVQDVLNRRLKMGKTMLRTNTHAGEDVISFKQLLTALYVMDHGGTVIV